MNIPYNQGIKSNQVKPLYNSNINQNIINESFRKNYFRGKEILFIL